ncbi:amino acid adenylation domain-containing protein [Plectonema cf. radiosum LEGE 06105]|uniref:Amino acid adenylation domain-containing protein n=1 Tax=Plectonema cf. radiosum LEGE 06105 TaxID=945769 RepID=A0A8J7F2J8_9CYAN|nr:non-ribosomal peptide synthetase [Plectonema radiosum]MBE9214963.1 amino acid adenylation domain-containing protein [Plectonema cf. radiosum LEGE 06105]
MDDLKKRIAALPPEKRALFERQLQQKGLQLDRATICKRQNIKELPLSFAQQRLWFLHQLEPNTTAYNIAIAWRFTGNLDIAVLKSCLNTIVQRHEILRTAFVAVNGQPTQVIIPEFVLPLPIFDLRTVPELTRQIEVEKLTKQEAQCPFDLTEAALLRVKLLQIADNENILLLTLHHLIADGWSRGIILRELTALYKGTSLPELPIQYVDFAVYQQQWLQGEELAVQTTYWKQQLNNLSILELPTDNPRKPVQTFSSATESVLISKEILHSLKNLSRQQGVTLFMSVLAAFKVLLHRYTSQDDIVIGSPIANRNWQELEPLIGFFVNTLVLRTDVSGNPSFLQLLQRVKDVAAGAFKHQDLPFAKLVEEIQPQRSLSHNPLFGIMFQVQNEAYQLQNALNPELAIPGLSLEQMWSDSGSTKFDMTWHLVERNEGLLAVVEYSTDLFNRDTIVRMLGHFQVLLLGIIDNPNQRLSELPILTEIEHQQLVEWNNTYTKYPLQQGIHQLFAAQVEKTPNNIAVAFKEEKFTYQELNNKANQLAHYLRKQGVKPDMLVGICVERNPLMLIGLLGILKAGGAYVPIDVKLPSSRIAFMLADSQVSILITQEKILAQLPAHSAQTICLDSEWETISQLPVDNPPNQTVAENLAYVIYTSGSTGNPKGTLLTHQGLTNYLSWAIQAYDVAQGNGSPVQSSVGFDATITSLYAPLMVGKTVTLVPEEQEIEALSSLLNSESDFSLVKLTPAHLKVLSQMKTSPPSPLLGKERGDMMRSSPLLNERGAGGGVRLNPTRAFIIGGEALLENHLNFWRENFPNTRLINEYGPTETVVGCCIYDTSNKPATTNAVPIGSAIANVQLYVLDKYLQPVPVGIPGELYIGGVGVARGYLNKPELTAEKFILNPFFEGKTSPHHLLQRREPPQRSGSPSPLLTKERGVREDGVRLYKTGDRVRYLPDGNLEYLGRLDNQVKIRGFRIELEEVEAVLNQHPQIQEACVIVCGDEFGNQRLVAYIVKNRSEKCGLGVSSSGATFQERDAEGAEEEEKEEKEIELRQFLQRRLPDYMVPSFFVELETLPLTNNGKVDRKALPIPDLSQRENVKNTPPTTEKEIILTKIWSEVLGVNVGINDNFFEMGGDSILSIQIIARANQAGLTLTPRQLFQYQTIAELATVADTKPQIEAEQGIITGEVPLIPIQHWFFEQIPEVDHYNQSVLLEVVPNLKPELLEQVWQKLLTHHDALRLRYVEDNSQWRQFYVNPIDIPFTTVDLSELTENEQKNKITVISSQLQTSLDLSKCLLRCVLFRLGASKNHRLLIIIHHLIIDSVSWRILLTDLATAYKQTETGLNIQLPSKTTSFQNWANQLINYAQSKTVLDELNYWLSVNSDVSLPVDYQNNETQNTIAATAQINVNLDAEQTRALLEEVPKAYKTQINDILLTALLQSFNQWTNVPTLLIDLEAHGREDLFSDVDLSRTVGWFTTIFPVILKLDNNRNLEAIIKSVKEQLRQIPARGFGYSLLRYLIKDEIIKTRLQNQHQAQIKFNYLGKLDFTPTDSLILGLAKEPTGELRSPKGKRQYLLEINSWISEDKLQLTWNYSRNIHQQKTIENLAQTYITNLQTLMNHCKSPESGGYTPSDFKAANLNQKQLDKFMSKIKKRK